MQDYPETLLKHQPSVEIYDSMRQYHQQKYKSQCQTPPENEEIIDSILPPTDWTDHSGKLHIHYVSHQAATREDVVELRETLEKTLLDRQAKKTGICKVREELYSQLFDELIRQVAVDCPERGLLQMRVRDEHMMTLAAYQTIYQSSISYGIRKQTESQQGTDQLENELFQLEQQQEELEVRKGQLNCQKELLEREIKQNRVIWNEKKDEELKYLKQQKDNMAKFLESVKMEYRQG